MGKVIAAFASWLAAAFGPMVIELLAKLGICVVTYGGLKVIGDQVMNRFLTSIHNSQYYNIIALTGFIDFAGICFAAWFAKIAMQSYSKFQIKTK